MTWDDVRRRHRAIYSLLVHESGHAVVAWESGARLGRLFVDRYQRCGGVAFSRDAAIGRFVPQSRLHRLAAEREMLIFHAGFQAELRLDVDCDRGYPVRDYAAIFELAQQFSNDAATIDAWSDYIQERARCVIEQPATWARILALALELSQHAQPNGVMELAGEEVDRYLATVRVPRTNAFLAYRRREARNVFVLFEDTKARQSFFRKVDAARTPQSGHERRDNARPE